MDFRMNGSVPIKGGFNASFIYRNTPGAAEDARLTISATTPGLVFKNGRTAVATTFGNPVLNLITPNSLFGPRFNQLDLSLNRTTDIGWGKLRLAFDLYNAMNSNSVQNVTTAYSTAANTNRWLRATTFLDPRLARVTASIQF
jgi:hypothetical protein